MRRQKMAEINCQFRAHARRRPGDRAAATAMGRGDRTGMQIHGLPLPGAPPGARPRRAEEAEEAAASQPGAAATDKAIEILNDYARTLKSISGHDARHLVGTTGIHFVNAAELVAHSEAGWSAEDREIFGEAR